MGEDTDEHLDKEIHRVRSGKVLRFRSFVHVESGCITLPVWTCQLGSSLNLVLFIGIFMGMPDELWNEVHDIVQETGIKTIPKEKKSKMAV